MKVEILQGKKIFLVFLFCFIFSILCFCSEKVFTSSLAGKWYPSKKETLLKLIKTYIQQASLKIELRPTALIVPHAGYFYSGKTAAYGYKLVSKYKYNTVFILGPSHYFQFDYIALLNASKYKTILGEISVDTAKNEKLIKMSKLFRYNQNIHTPEHSVGNQIPFIQFSLRNVRIVPMIVGHLSYSQLKKAASIIKKVIGNHDLIIVSSDFTHYGPNYNYVPFTINIPKNIKKLDMGFIHDIIKGSPEKLYKYYTKTHITVCGIFPILILKNIFPESYGELLSYTRSGDLTGDYTNSVSYACIALSPNAPPNSHTSVISPIKFTPEEKKYLLKLARATLYNYIKFHKKISPSEVNIPLTTNMKKKFGGFVTLKKHGILRGCIGEIFPTRSIYKVIIDRTIDAAVNDPRFPPVRAEELKDIEIEISILTPPKRVPSYKDIVIGRDGIYLIKGYYRAVFLPQVAPEQGWSLIETLQHLCLKAGLAPDAWKKNCIFYTFQALVFSE